MSPDNTGLVSSDETKQAKDNEGARALREKYPDRGGVAEVARLCDADPSAVSRWFSGDRKPDTKMRALLEDKTGIRWRLFDDETESSSEPAA